jgi:hypothetical protein
MIYGMSGKEGSILGPSGGGFGGAG